MVARITVLPASTKAGRETIRVLLESDSKLIVCGIYRDPLKAPEEFTRHENFQVKQGDVATDGLDFTGSDAVFYVPPPIYDGTDQAVWARQTASNVKSALERAPEVTRLLLFSSMGSQYDHGIGILRLNHISDGILGNATRQVIIVKPGYFQENWAHAFETIKADPPVLYSPITPPDHKIPMVSIKDVGENCARVLLAEEFPANPYVFDLYGPRHYSSNDAQAAVEEVTGKKVKLISIEKDHLAEFYANEVPPAHIQDMAEMTTSVLPGGIMAGDFDGDEFTVKGRVGLAGTLRELYKI